MMGSTPKPRSLESYEPDNQVVISHRFLGPLYGSGFEDAPDYDYLCYPREVLFGPIATLHLHLIRNVFQIRRARSNFDCDSHALTFAAAAQGYHGRRVALTPQGAAVGFVSLNPIPELGYTTGHRVGTAVLPDFSVIYIETIPDQEGKVREIELSTEGRELFENAIRKVAYR